MAFSAGRFYPGDHKGCQCQAVPVLLYPEGTPQTLTAPTDRYPGHLSLADNQKWMTDQWGTRIPGYGNRKFDFRNLTTDAADDMSKELDDLFRKYPRSARGIRVTGGPEDPRTWDMHAWGVSNQRNGSLRVGRAQNQAAFENARAGVAEEARIGFHPAGNTEWSSVVSHEFGHHVLWRAMSTRDSAVAADQAIQAVFTKYLGPKPSLEVFKTGEAVAIEMKSYLSDKALLIQGEISTYALKNTDEMFAEAFAAVRSGQATTLERELVNAILPIAEG